MRLPMRWQCTVFVFSNFYSGFVWNRQRVRIKEYKVLRRNKKLAINKASTLSTFWVSSFSLKNRNENQKNLALCDDSVLKWPRFFAILFAWLPLKIKIPLRQPMSQFPLLFSSANSCVLTTCVIWWCFYTFTCSSSVGGVFCYAWVPISV